MRRWHKLPFGAKIKTIGYAISVASVVMLAIVSWKNAAANPLLAICLFGGMVTSITGMGLRCCSYEIEEGEKRDD